MRFHYGNEGGSDSFTSALLLRGDGKYRWKDLNTGIHKRGKGNGVY